MAIEIVSFPIKNGGSFHSYVSLPEGNINVEHFVIFRGQEAVDFLHSRLAAMPPNEQVRFDFLGDDRWIDR